MNLEMEESFLQKTIVIKMFPSCCFFIIPYHVNPFVSRTPNLIPYEEKALYIKACVPLLINHVK